MIRKDTIFFSNIKMNLSFGKVMPIYHIELESVNEKEALSNLVNRSKIYVNKNGKWYKK
jgi:hypothetical protein